MTLNRSGRGAVIFIFLTVLVDTIGFGIILPVTPRLVMELSGEGLAKAAIYGGWLGFVYALMQFFCAPILGGLSDRYGRRPVILAALGALGTDYLIMGFAPNLHWLFLGRTIAGMAGASFTPAYAYLADVTPPERRAQNFGLVGAAFGMGFIIGPAVGGLLGEFGPRAPFFAAAALALANCVFGFFVLPESLPLASRRPFELRRANPLGTLMQVRRYPAVIGLMTALFIWQLGHQVLPSTWAFYTIYRFNWSPGMVGASLAFVGVIMAVSTAGLTRALVPRLGERRAALLGIVSGFVVYLGYAFATEGWMIYVAMLPWLFAGMVHPSMQAIMSHAIPPNAQGELQGGIASLYSISSIAGPPLMTQLFGYFSSGAAPVHFPGAAFLCAALLSFAAALLFLRAVGGTIADTAKTNATQNDTARTGPAQTEPAGTPSATAPDPTI
ncbi:MAG TPA: TCR/Tet family MFS transporter [Candidatus Polarisedimenticolia bacterium]|nr:TCR/Tet family MFS transporter [Candidatus Polarisedimenticolia bacterium]